jgi:hypothetical protein
VLGIALGADPEAALFILVGAGGNKLISKQRDNPIEIL